MMPKLINMRGRHGDVSDGAVYICRQIPWLRLPRSK
jgi:hypothetical protein